MFHPLPPPSYTYYCPSVLHAGYCYPSYFPQYFAENTVKTPKEIDFMNDQCYQQQYHQLTHCEICPNKNLALSTQEQKAKQEQNQLFLQHQQHTRHYGAIDDDLALDIKNKDLAEVNDDSILPDLEYILLPKEQLPAQEEASIEDMERLPKRHLLWTDKEDKLLIKLRIEQNLRWKEISFHFPERSINSCQFRWKKLKLIKQLSKVNCNKTVHKVSKNTSRYSKLKSLCPGALAEKKNGTYAKYTNNNRVISANHTSNIKLLLN